MAETLFNAYLPLVLWTGLGLVAFRLLPQAFPRFLGRTLYWFGVPWQILALARQTDFSQNIGLAPAITIGALGLGLAGAWVTLLGLKRWSVRAGIQANSQIHPEDALQVGEPLTQSANMEMNRPREGSFIIAATLGNTGFVGLGLVPSLIAASDLSWAVFYSVTQNVVGTYGIGVFLASYFGRPQQKNHWWVQVRDVLTVPSLWAFTIGSLTRSVEVPAFVELGLHASLWFVIPAAFLLMGMRLNQLQGWHSLKLALLPTLLKVIVLPGLVGLAATLLGLGGDPRLALVLMAGMPSAFAGLILAEEYELDRELIASSIALSTIALLFTIPIWLALFD